METLVNFVKTNDVSSLITAENVVKSSYHTHYRDGDSDNTVEGFPCNANVGTITDVDNIKYICYKATYTDPEARGWRGNTESSYWLTVEATKSFMKSTSANLLALIRCELPRELINLPINWATELSDCKYANHSGQFACGTNYSVAYYEDQIQIEEECWTSYIQQCSKSTTRVVGQWNIKTGENTTYLLVEYKKRQYFNEKVKLLQEKGLNKKQAFAFMGLKVSWKWEFLELKLSLVNNSVYQKQLFKELSEATSNAKFDKIAKNWGLDELCSFSHPRKTAYSKLIYAIK